MVYQGSFIDILEGLFGPFYGLDIPSFYGQYHPVIDFFLYSAVFVSVARLTLDKLFQGKAGKALAVAVGLILALSLSIAERNFGFSIRSFGPIAAGIIVAMVGLVIFHLCRKAGAATPTAGSLAVIIVYFSVRSVVPNLFEWMQHNKWAAFLHGLLVLAILVALWRVIGALFRSPAGHIGRLAKTIETSPASRVFGKKEGFDRKELKLLRHRLSKFTGEAMKNSEEIIAYLRDMIEIIHEHGADNRSLPVIAARLRQIEPREHHLLTELRRIRKIDKRLRQFDLTGLADLQSRYRHLSAEQKKACRTQFTQGRQKLGAEKEIAEISRAVDDYQRQFRYSLEMAAKCLGARRPEEAIQWLEKATEQESAAQELLKRALALEKRLISFVRRQLRQAVATE